MHAGTGKCTAVRKSLISGTRLMVHIPQLYQLFDGAPSGCGASRPKMGGDTFLPMGIRVSQVLETPFRARWCTPARLMHHPGAESAWSAGIAGSGMCTTKSNTKRLLGRNIVRLRLTNTPSRRASRAPRPSCARAPTGSSRVRAGPGCCFSVLAHSNRIGSRLHAKGRTDARRRRAKLYEIGETPRTSPNRRPRPSSGVTHRRSAERGRSGASRRPSNATRCTLADDEPGKAQRSRQ